MHEVRVESKLKEMIFESNSSVRLNENMLHLWLTMQEGSSFLAKTGACLRRASLSLFFLQVLAFFVDLSDFKTNTEQPIIKQQSISSLLEYRVRLLRALACAHFRTLADVACCAAFP
jgi:hypothetical protein